MVMEMCSPASDRRRQLGSEAASARATCWGPHCLAAGRAWFPGSSIASFLAASAFVGAVGLLKMSCFMAPASAQVERLGQSQQHFELGIQCPSPRRSSQLHQNFAAVGAGVGSTATSLFGYCQCSHQERLPDPMDHLI